MVQVVTTQVLVVQEAVVQADILEQVAQAVLIMQQVLMVLEEVQVAALELITIKKVVAEAVA